MMSGSPVRRSDAPDASQSEICKQLARVVLDFAKPVFLTQPANRGIRFEDFLGLHAPTRWYKFATRVSNDICIQGEPCKRAELVRHVRAVAKLAGGIRVLRAKKD